MTTPSNINNSNRQNDKTNSETNQTNLGINQTNPDTINAIRNPNNPIEQKKQLDRHMLEQIRTRDTNTAQINTLISLLIAAETRLTDKKSRNTVFYAIRLLRSKTDTLLSAKEQKTLLILMQETIIEIESNIKYLHAFKRNIRNSVHIIHASLFELVKSENLFLENEGFLWKGLGTNEHLFLQHQYRYKRLHEDIYHLWSHINELHLHVPANDDYRVIVEQMTLFDSHAQQYIGELRHILELQNDALKNKEILMRKELAIGLNNQIKTLPSFFDVVIASIEKVLPHIEAQLTDLEISVQNIRDEITKTQNSKMLKPTSDTKSKEPRILMLTHEFVSGGGVATVSRKLVEYARNDFKIDVIERPIEGVNFTKLCYYKLPTRLSKNPTGIYKDIPAFVNTHPELKLQLIHTQSINFAYGLHHWENGGLDELKNLYRGIPIVCTCHSFVRHEKDVRLENRDLPEPWMDYSITCQDQTISLSNTFIVLHEFGRQQLKHYYPSVKDSEIHVIPNGIDQHPHFIRLISEVHAMTERIFSPHKLILLYVGRISREKGLLELIKAVPRLARHYPQLSVVIVGDCGGKTGTSEYNPLYAELVSMLKDSHAEKYVIWTGAVNNNELAKKVYDKYKPDLAILPSHHESFPIFALEALSFGVPLLVTDCDGPREIYSPFRIIDSPDGKRQQQHTDEIYAHLNPAQSGQSTNTQEHNSDSLPGVNVPMAVAIDPQSPESIVIAVHWVVNHPREVHALLKNAVQVIEKKYTWSAIARETGKLYNSLISKKPFVSQYTVTKLQTKMLDISRQPMTILSDTISVGVISHFKYANDIYPDVVAEFTDEIMKFFEMKNINVEGLALIGDDAAGKSIVRLYYAPALYRAVIASNYDIIIVFLSHELSLEVIQAARDKGAKILLFVPYWGVHEKIFDFISLADFVFVFTRSYADKLHSKTGQNLLSIPYVIDCDYQPQKNKKHETFVLLYTGVINDAKMLHLCIPEFIKHLVPKERILGKKVELHFLIKKSYKDENAYQSIINNQQLYDADSRIHITYIELSKKQEYDAIANADIVIIPSSFEEIGSLAIKSIFLETPVILPYDLQYHLSIPMGEYLQALRYPFLTRYVTSSSHTSTDSSNQTISSISIDWEDFFNKVIEVGTTKNIDSIMRVYSRAIRRYFSRKIFETTLFPALEYVHTHVASQKPKEINLTTRFIQPQTLFKEFDGRLYIDSIAMLLHVRSKIKIASIYGLWDEFNLDHAESINRLELSRELSKLGYPVDLIESKSFDISSYSPPAIMHCVSYTSANYYNYSILMTSSLGGLATLKRLGLEHHPFILGSMERVTFDTSKTQKIESGDTISRSFVEGQEFCHRIARLVHVWSSVPYNEWIRIYGEAEHKRIFISECGAPTEITVKHSNPFPTKLNKKEILLYLGALPVERQEMINKIKRIAEAVCNGTTTVMCIISNDYKKLQAAKTFDHEIGQGVITLLAPVNAHEQYTYYAYASLAINTGVSSKTEIISAKLLHYLRGGIPVICEDTYTNAHLIKDGFNGFLVKYQAEDMTEYIAAVKKGLEKSRKKEWDRKAIIQEMVKNNTWAARVKIYDKHILTALGFTLSKELAKSLGYDNL